MSSAEWVHSDAWIEAHNAEARAVATALRGSEFYLDFYTDPDYARELIDFIVAGTTARIQGHRRFFGLFVLREGNNLAPGTPLANLEAMYATARAWVP